MPIPESGVGESIQYAFRFALKVIRAVAPLQLSASGYRVALRLRSAQWKQIPFAFCESAAMGGAAATGVAGAVFAVGLPSTTSASSLRDVFTQTFRAP